MQNIRERKLYSLDAFIFYLDGIIAKTHNLEASAWKRALDEFLLSREPKNNQRLECFQIDKDYDNYFKGKQRFKGLQLFLKSLNIYLPIGAINDGTGQETLCGLENSKNDKFKEALEEQGVEVCVATLGFIEGLKERGFLVGAASFNNNCKLMLEFAGIEDLFDAVVDGIDAERLGLPDKPQGNIFAKVVEALGTDAKRTAVIEDSALGVQAGINGGLGLVIGYAHDKNEQELKESGADYIITDFEAITYDEIEVFLKTRGQKV